VSADPVDWKDRFSEFVTGSINSDGEQKGYCPLHEDPATSKTPSASFNWKSHLFFCFGGCRGYDFKTLWKVVLEDRGDLDTSRPDNNVRDIGTAKSAAGKPS